MGDPTFGSSFFGAPLNEGPLVIETPQQTSTSTPMMTPARNFRRGMGLREEDDGPERGTGWLEETPETDKPQGPATSKFVDAHKIAAVLAKHNIKDVDPALLNIKDIKEDAKNGMTLKLDNGHELHMGALPNGTPSISWKPGELNRHDAAAIVSLGKSAGFGDVNINGNDRDKTLLCIEAAKQGVKVLNPPPQEIFEKYKKEIEAEERNPGQGKPTVADQTAPADAANGAPKRQATRTGGPRM